MKDDPLFARYVNATAELQALDLAPLTTPELTALFINTYNALIVHALVVLGSPQGTLGRLEFFGAAKYIIGGQVYSADDMENGVLRGNAAPASSLWVLLGFPQLAKGQFSKRANDPRARKVVPKVDARIHFALVCGAKSCPPIKMYTPDNLDEGLQAAGEAFCASEVVVSRAINTVTLSKIFKWYAPDFGRTDTERLTWLAQFLQGQQRQDLDAMLASSNSSGSIKIKHKDYDWSLNGSE
ncbi:hypothetical protein FOA52_010922 [Chlamydomonas sp. UWO 241]|nr:hypothetical protein FOA52_010922 [Chlamydomonas sp. UWO 241]